MKKFAEEFKKFIMRGNVMDMAVGVIVGAAFGAITTALVGNVITPLLSWAFGAPNTDALNITLRAADEAAGTEALVLGLYHVTDHALITWLSCTDHVAIMH